MPRSPYPDLWARMMANSTEPALLTSCWIWTAKRDRWGYGRINVYVPGLGRVVILMAHIAAWVWLEAECQTADELYLAYIELQASGLELDHRCTTPPCIFPDHLLPMTGAENCQLRNQRRAA